LLNARNNIFPRIDLCSTYLVLSPARSTNCALLSFLQEDRTPTIFYGLVRRIPTIQAAQTDNRDHPLSGISPAEFLQGRSAFFRDRRFFSGSLRWPFHHNHTVPFDFVFSHVLYIPFFFFWPSLFSALSLFLGFFPLIAWFSLHCSAAVCRVLSFPPLFVLLVTSLFSCVFSGWRAVAVSLCSSVSVCFFPPAFFPLLLWRRSFFQSFRSQRWSPLHLLLSYVSTLLPFLIFPPQLSDSPMKTLFLRETPLLQLRIFVPSPLSPSLPPSSRRVDSSAIFEIADWLPDKKGFYSLFLDRI